jgi:hypothetical protein
MAQVLVGSDAIPHDLLEFLDLGKPTPFSSRPDGVIFDSNFENTSSTRQ